MRPHEAESQFRPIQTQVLAVSAYVVVDAGAACCLSALQVL